MIKRESLGFSTFELLLIFVIACILGGIVLTKHSEVSQNNRNEKRKNDIEAIQTAIDTYKAANDKYPSIAQINNTDFRKQNLKTLVDNNLKDPHWKKSNKSCTSNNQPTLQGSLKPDTNCYGYAVSPVNCDNTTTDCTSYTITANLEPPQVYSKTSTD